MCATKEDNCSNVWLFKKVYWILKLESFGIMNYFYIKCVDIEDNTVYSLVV